MDSTSTDSTVLKSDSITSDSIVKKEELPLGKLEISIKENTPCIFQLLQKEKVISEFYFSKKPYLMDEIIPGKYQLKYIVDNNQDRIWNTGNWEGRILAEKVANYPSEIIIRSNWDLELEWIIQE